MKLAIALLGLFLGGCLGLGVNDMTAAQIRATEGMATCVDVYTMYGKGRSVTVHVDAAKRGIDEDYEQVIGPDCTITIRGTTRTQAGPKTQPPAARSETTSTTTTTTKTVQEK